MMDPLGNLLVLLQLYMWNNYQPADVLESDCGLRGNGQCHEEYVCTVLLGVYFVNIW